MSKRGGARQNKPKNDGTRYLFWVNMLLVFILIAFLILGQWDFLLAGVLVFFVLNGLLPR